MCKSDKYIYWVKKDLFGCFRIEEIRDKDNETGLKEGIIIQILTTVLHSRAAPSLLILLYSPPLFLAKYLQIAFGSVGT